MTENAKELTRDEIERLMVRLDEVLTQRGKRAIIYVVGGANIAMTLDDRRTTTDVDVVARSGYEDVLDASREVALAEEGLGEDWLNAAFAGYGPDGGMAWSWLDNKDDDTPRIAYSGRSLNVELASPQMMLALKILAARPKDLQDIYALMRHTGIRTREDLSRNVERFTGRRLFEAQGKAGTYIHIGANLKRVMDEAPDDLRTATRPGLWARLTASTGSARRAAESREPRCPEGLKHLRDGIEVGRSQCRRPEGHRGKHSYERVR